MTEHPGALPGHGARGRPGARARRDPMRPWHRWRQAVNMLNGATLTGIVVASAGGARLRPAADGLLVGAGYRLPVPPRARVLRGQRADHPARLRRLRR